MQTLNGDWIVSLCCRSYHGEPGCNWDESIICLPTENIPPFLYNPPPPPPLNHSENSSEASCFLLKTLAFETTPTSPPGVSNDPHWFGRVCMAILEPCYNSGPGIVFGLSLLTNVILGPTLFFRCSPVSHSIQE